MASRFEKAWKGRIKREKEKKRRKKKKLTIDLARILNSKLQKQIESNLDCDAVCITKFTANGFFKVLTRVPHRDRSQTSTQPPTPRPSPRHTAIPHLSHLSHPKRTVCRCRGRCSTTDSRSTLPDFLVLPPGKFCSRQPLLLLRASSFWQAMLLPSFLSPSLPS